MALGGWGPLLQRLYCWAPWVTAGRPGQVMPAVVRVGMSWVGALSS
jgi:hypothetical protein